MNERKHGPLISVVVPVYGTEEYFTRCMDSLLEQTYPDLEILVVNDGSKGDIRERIKKYTAPDSNAGSGPIVRFLDFSENAGLLRARVLGAREASGEFIAFVDSDDYVSSDFYRVLLSRAVETSADIVIGGTVREEGENRYIYNYHDSAFLFDELVGEDVQKAFFSQELQNYSWHTVWNKLYRKSLWDLCMPEYEKIEEHVVMTEDICFSSILFLHAKKVVTADSAVYFYCVNENASTDARDISFSKFRKNMHDMQVVFDEVGAYLNRSGASDAVNFCIEGSDASDAVTSCIEGSGASDVVKRGFQGGRAHYARMWRSLAEGVFQGEEAEKASKILERFEYGGNLDVSGSISGRWSGAGEDYFFESVQTPWNGGLDNIKREIRESREPYVSFDIFDTLVVRPFYDPSDIFMLLNPKAQELLGTFISFAQIRKEGEALAREYYGTKYGWEDITLKEIYTFISEHYGIGQETTDRIRELEEELEVRFCSVRRSGCELFEFAKAVGKRVVLISDMYLEEETIRKILAKCGITGYEKIFISCKYRKLKYDGSLFWEAASEIAVNPGDLFHIGDTWKSDILGSGKAGVRSIFFPKAREVFENKIQGCRTNRLGSIGETVFAGNRTGGTLMKNLGYRCMLAIAANMYFDNPYRTFNAETDFNMDPYFMGFYPLGMHMLGISKWLHETMSEYGYEHLVFFARDGYLPMKAFERYLAYVGPKHSGSPDPFGQQKQTDFRNFTYMQASRKAVMPILLRERVNFYQMPIEYRAHTPMTLVQVLSFAADEEKMKAPYFSSLLRKEKIDPEKPFESLKEFHDFIDFFLGNLYDSKKHREAVRRVQKYYGSIPDKSLAFDMGYSGRIQSAVCAAAGKRVDAAFLHEDYETSVRARAYGGFRIRSFYDYRPAVSGLIREHIFSDTNGSCYGFDEAGDPLLEKPRHIVPTRFVVERMQEGALSFVEEFGNQFHDFPEVLDFSGEEVSMPFEGLLRCPDPADLQVFSASYFEDLVFGAREEINIGEFVKRTILELDRAEKAGSAAGARSLTEEEEILSTLPDTSDAKRILDIVNRSPQVKRGLVWMILDWSFFTEKVKINIRRLFGK